MIDREQVVGKVLRVLGFACVALLAFTLAGLPWVLLAGLELWWSPVVGVVVVTVAK